MKINQTYKEKNVFLKVNLVRTNSRKKIISITSIISKRSFKPLSFFSVFVKVNIIMVCFALILCPKNCLNKDFTNSKQTRFDIKHFISCEQKCRIAHLLKFTFLCFVAIDGLFVNKYLNKSSLIHLVRNFMRSFYNI